MKKIIITTLLILSFGLLFAQSDDELFGGGDDDLFFDDGIEELEISDSVQTSENLPKSDLSKGILYQDGSIKIGGSFTTGITTMTTLYENSEEDKTFKDKLKESQFTPNLSAYLTLDARPTQTLRMYTKFGLSYPFSTQGDLFSEENSINTNWFTLKEMFTDFSIADTAFFRFGLHTVSWGAGYFFSPVSDMINTSSINPEDVSAQVNGALNLRTQITFPNTQNCLWFYVIPDTNFIQGTTSSSYVIDTALAGKADLVFGGWELGVGGFYKYQHAPKAMLTATGSVKKLSLFGEAVYAYGSETEWQQNEESWADKTNIFQATAGCMYMWKNPSITLAAQYYYDGTPSALYEYSYSSGGYYPTLDISASIPSFTQGHNVAMLINFGRIFGTTDVTATVFGMLNFGREDIEFTVPNELREQFKTQIEQLQNSLKSGIVSALLMYTPIPEIKISAGPYLTFNSLDEAPVVSLKLDFILGGGKF